MFGERQCADGSLDLGHRRELEDGVGGHGHTLDRVGLPEGLEVDQLAVARDGHHRSRYALAFDLAGEEGVDVLQPFGRHADAVRCGRGQGLGRGRAVHAENADCLFLHATRNNCHCQGS